ncbi:MULTISPECIES: hypothetical protein [Streptomyces]|jgi:hypothetical protein|uniref:Uncharacterized protein n=1 Tax=Streptomyces prunicolor TaxID=67348 RepID=A0ABU4FPI1_9ACTN|nr:hypothetical protein [Streptomyces prunicolor]MCX5238300.1 hypothetical protein [Streptomyces prunicolor]MDV7221903.1 hypothetical protein [Streptomyces prunicolor]
MSNAYSASPPALVAGTRQIEQISQLANEMISEFITDVSSTSGWPGYDDDFAKQMRPQEKQQREGSVQTGSSLSEAIVSIGDGTLTNLKSVLGTQNGVLDAIHDSSTGDTDSGSHNGKH